MTDDHRDAPEPGRPDAERPTAGDDPGANTEMFRAFVDRDDPPPPRPVGVPFRVVTLLIGLVVFAGVVWLLLR